MESDNSRPRKVRAVLIPLVLFLLTLLCTTALGSRVAFHFERNLPSLDFVEDLMAFPDLLHQPRLLLDGLPYSLALLLILLAHEFGHYFACRYHHVLCTLPWFIPAPSFIGTFGAFIRFRSPVKSRRELFDIGIAGPLAGFIFVLPALGIGLALSRIVPGLGEAGDARLGLPLAVQWIGAWLFPGANLADLNMHPVARAAWVGLLATALNLLPVGQLDGGHIVYSWLGERHRWVSFGTIGVLAVMGFLFWPWFFWAGVLLLVGRRHFPVYDDERLDWRRKALLIVAVLILIVAFMPAPLQYNEPQEWLH
ncbi:MAG: site-2 protease family protein [Bryobacteraceae bacterium]|nr:site-2 protease family protein [Bryobacteraceae bacterium]